MRCYIVVQVTAVMQWLAGPRTEVTVKAVDRKKISRQPPAPFITSSLQQVLICCVCCVTWCDVLICVWQESSRRLGFSPKKAMMVAQRLYENGYITYMRTDSPVLGAAAQETARRSAVEMFGPDSVKGGGGSSDRDDDGVARSEGVGKSGQRAKAPKNAQEAHEAIRPAMQREGEGGVVFCHPDTLPGLDTEERRLYDLIYRRTVASTMQPSLSSSTTYTLSASSVEPLLLPEEEGAEETAVASAELKASVTELLSEGFLAALGSTGHKEKGAATLTRPMEVGQRLGLFASAGDGGSSGSSNGSLDTNVIDTEEMDSDSSDDSSRTIRLKECPGLVGTEHETRPPSRFTESSFIHELESVGVGRPSTYSYILEKLQSIGYVIVEGKTIVPSVKGMLVSQMLAKYFPALVEPEFTADMELSLDKIAAGQQDRVEFLTKFYFGDDAVEDSNTPNAGGVDTGSSGSKKASRGKGSRSGGNLGGRNGLVAQAVHSNFTDIENINMCRILDMPSIRHLGHLNYDTKGIQLVKNDPITTTDGTGDAEAARGGASAGAMRVNARWRLPAHMERDLRLITPEAMQNLVGSTPAYGDVAGRCPDSDRPLYVRAGKFGRYVQLGEDRDADKVQAPIPNWVDDNSCSTAELAEFATLPKEICRHPQIPDRAVMLSVRGGVLGVRVEGYPYYFAPIEEQLTPSQVTPEMVMEATSDVDAIVNSKRTVGQWDGQDILLLTGKFGPFLTCQGINW
jgi:DNA topoisomerase IA